MFKVECESCKAPYQIDERRVPSAGLKMRCPKCGHSFLVTHGGSVAGVPAPAPAPPPAARLDARAAAPAAPPPLAGRPAPAPPRPEPAKPAAGRNEPLKQTMLGVGGDVALPTARGPLPSDFPAALGSLEESDLPVVSAGLPALRANPAAPKAPVPPPLPRRAVARGSDLDLPALAADLPTAKAPARAAPVPPPRPTLGSDLDLPSPAADLPAIKPPAKLFVPGSKVVNPNRCIGKDQSVTCREAQPSTEAWCRRAMLTCERFRAR